MGIRIASAIACPRAELVLGLIAFISLAAFARAEKPPAASETGAPPIRLFKYASTQETTPAGAARLQELANPYVRVIQSRSAELADFDPLQLKKGDRLLVDITPGESYEVVLLRVYPIYGGYTGLIGEFPGFASSSFQLVIGGADGSVGGQFDIGARSIGVHSEQSGTRKVVLVERVFASDGPPGQRPLVFDDVGRAKPITPDPPHTKE